MYFSKDGQKQHKRNTNLHLYHDDCMDLEIYETVYKNDPLKIKRYIGLLSLYEYLAFSYTMKELQLPDPLGYQWTERWATDLLEYPEFRQIHEYHKEYYPEFANYIDEALQERKVESGKSLVDEEDLPYA